MRKGKAMRRRDIIISFLLVFVLSVSRVNTVSAQVFIMDDEEDAYIDRVGGTAGLDPGGFDIPGDPGQDNAQDWTPLGDGILLLGCLGGAYLLGKRRKREED